MTIGKPIAFRVLLKPDSVKKKKQVTTDSGIIIDIELALDEKLEEGATQTGTIVAIGPDVYSAFKTTLKYGGLKVGQHVAFAKYAGKWVDIDGGKFLIVNDEDIVMEFADDSSADVETVNS